MDIEPSDGPEASWAMPLVTPTGRVYAFYTYNAENRREVIADDPPFAGGLCSRVDSFGQYAFKYSDDGGQTWSHDRYFIPVREMEIDRNNAYGGALRFFWGVGKPIVHDGSVFFGFSKVGGFGKGFFTSSESCFMQSDNILTEPDPAKIEWETLPEGDHGLRSPEGPIAEEVNLTALSDGSLYCTYRTDAGHPCHAYSRDRGRTWTPPAFMTFHPRGPVVCNPRAANFVHRIDGGPYAGRFIYWFHNHDGRGYEGRNPAWLLGGVERDSPNGRVIHWGHPEVVLYAHDLKTRISYPDFIEDDERLFISETQKSIARIHEVPAWLLSRLWETLGE